MPHFVADIGNTRLKIARLEPSGIPSEHSAFAVGDPSTWQSLAVHIGLTGEPSTWSIASVNPPAAERFREVLERDNRTSVRWYNSAANIPIANRLERPEATGVDRALAVLAGRMVGNPGEWGLVVSCGTAITIERVLEDGTWDGGAIAPGLSLGARSLGRETAQLPHVHFDRDAPFWGHSTIPAIEAGVFWGTVGALRELIARQRESRPEPWIVWTGGDAERLAVEVVNGPPVICPDLVLRGLALLASSNERVGG
jgi:type III pantothenate kinase